MGMKYDTRYVRLEITKCMKLRQVLGMFILAIFLCCEAVRLVGSIPPGPIGGSC